ncbi:hypothetical protein [Nakamurella panacisegetis]|uniref:hypothetical protein n=1 Tax=Nakamurella panacisegetis TaxID=1090615 RepID=UPI0018D41E62|nr:hypothetical protein [Nakamurella panacisegetis]
MVTGAVPQVGPPPAVAPLLGAPPADDVPGADETILAPLVPAAALEALLGEELLVADAASPGALHAVTASELPNTRTINERTERFDIRCPFVLDRFEIDMRKPPLAFQ